MIYIQALWRIHSKLKTGRVREAAKYSTLFALIIVVRRTLSTPKKVLVSLVLLIFIMINYNSAVSIYFHHKVILEYYCK